MTPVFTWADSRCAADAARFTARIRRAKNPRGNGLHAARLLLAGETALAVRTQPSPCFEKCSAGFPRPIGFSEELFGAERDQSFHGQRYWALRSRPTGAGIWLCASLRDQSGHLSTFPAEPVDRAEAIRRSSSRKARVFNRDWRWRRRKSRFVAPATLRTASPSMSGQAPRSGYCGRKRCNRPCRAFLPDFFVMPVDQERAVLGGAVSNAGNLHQWCLRSSPGDRRGEVPFPECRSDRRANGAPFLGKRARAHLAGESCAGQLSDLTRPPTPAKLCDRRVARFFIAWPESSISSKAPPLRRDAIIVSGGILHSTASLRLLADSLGRDLWISSQAEASLRGAAIYVLEKLVHRIASLPKAKVIRYDRAFAKKHRIRRFRQVALEKEMAEIVK